MEELNAIACENCRSKKCKCDRKLPACAQCRTSSLLCRYQEGGKRGLPAAYMTSLETRLIETETALSATLVALQTSSGNISVDGHLLKGSSTSSGRAQSKAEKQDEWKQLPLQTNEQLIAWFHTRRPFDAAPRESRMLPPQKQPTVPFPAARSTDYLRNGNPPVSQSSIRTDQNHLSNTQPTSTPPTSIQDQLKDCAPPTVPNSSDSLLYTSKWRDNYF